MTGFGKPGSASEVPGDAEPPATPEETADALEQRKDAKARDRFAADRKASSERGNRKR